jgi:hypothetical protein
MDYNNSVKITTPRSDAIRLIRFAALLWIGYLIVLALVSQVFQPPQPSPQPPQSADYLYYIFYEVIALLCLALSYWRWIQEKLKQGFRSGDSGYHYYYADYYQSADGASFPPWSAVRPSGEPGTGGVSFHVRRSSAGCLAV